MTFLFTDVEGSTQLFDQLGPAFSEILEQHRSIIRSAVAAHAGAEIKTEGDGFFIVFAGAAQAVAACYDAQVALASWPWPDECRLKVRMGLNSDVAQPTPDGDYVAVGVHRAARIASAAHGGQVLLSTSTAREASGQLPTGASLAERGQFMLKGLRDPERIFQLVHPELFSDFPPLRASPLEAHSLPSVRTSFLGRHEEIADLCQAMAQARLVTIVGVGGAGKTRLALEVGARLSVRSDGGTLLCDLSPVTDPEQVGNAFASAVGIHGTSDVAPLEAVTRALGGREVVMVVDNCEQVVESVASAIDSLVARVGGLRVLATSREPLRIPGEQVWWIPPLELPEIDASPAEVRASACGQLLEERARLVRPQFSIDDDNVTAVASICRQTEGLPLAVELAAARMATAPAGAVAARLAESLSGFGSGPRTGAARHQTLDAMIDWSYQLLTEPERGLLRRLAVFAGGFTPEAAEATAEPHDALGSFDVLELVADMANKSLVVFDSDADRYRLLEPIRQFAAARLGHGAEFARARRVHAEYFHALAMEAEAPLFGSDQAAWLDRLATEHENLRSAITWLLERELHESVARMLAALRRYWMIRADPAECLGWLRPLLDDGRLSLATRGRALVAAAILGCYQDPTTGEAWAQGAVEVGEALGDQPLVVEALGLVAANSYFSGKPDAAAGDRAASLAAELDDDVLKGWALLCSALAHYEHAAARDRALEDALEATATSGDLWVRSLVAGNLANAYVPDPARAQKAFTEAIRLEEVLGTSDAINKANLSWLLLDVGDTPQARVWVSRALRATGRTVYSSLAALDCAAAYACATQHWDRAAQLCGFIDQMARQSGIGVYGDKAQSGPSDSLTDRASLRTSLGEAYDPTYRVGTAMDWGDALRLARGIAAEPQEWDV